MVKNKRVRRALLSTVLAVATFLSASDLVIFNSEEGYCLYKIEDNDFQRLKYRKFSLGK